MNTRWNPQSLKVWHQELMDYMLLHPTASRSEIAEYFDVSEQMVTSLTKSDMFQMQLEQRRDRMALKVEETALARLQGKVARLAEVGVEKLTDAVSTGKCDIDGVRDTVDMALKSLGYGGGSGPARAPAQTQVNVIVLDKDTLASAREKMRAITHEHVPALPAA